MSAATENRLGKGIGALLEDASLQAAMEQGKGETFLPVTSLEPSSAQPRRTFEDEPLQSLASSIKTQGVLVPLLVRPTPGKTGMYEIIAGERRWRAAQIAGLKEVPVLIRQMTDSKALEVALVDNIQRKDLNAIDEAAGYLQLMNQFNYTHEDIARVTGKSRSHISNLIRLLALPESVKILVSEGALSMGHARTLLALQESDQQVKTARDIIKKGLSVRDTEALTQALVAEAEGRGEGRKQRSRKDDATQEIERRVAAALGYRTIIQQRDGVGHVRILFESSDELAGLLTKLGVA